jgi:hypothetical protein
MSKVKTEAEQNQPSEIYAYGYIVAHRPELGQVFNPEQGAGLAIVSLDGEKLDKYCVDDLFLLPYDPEVVAAVALKKNLRLVGIDPENYDWMRRTWIKVSNEILAARPDRIGKLPLLRVWERDKDLMFRQITSVQGIKAAGNYSVAQEINDPLILSGLEQYGQSMVPDMIAGGVELASDQREIILSNRSIVKEPATWNGLRRWNDRG